MLTLALLIAEPVAHAQDYEDLDGAEEATESARSSRRDRASSENVKEVAKGLYAKANVGAGAYLGRFNGFVNSGTAVGMVVGQDFIDKETSSMAWEVGFWQGIHNGMHYEIQAQTVGCYTSGGAGPCIQGDTRTYNLMANLEYSFYVDRRFGIGLRAGGGVLFSPLLMEEEAYTRDVLGTAWSGASDPGIHGAPHPLGFGGPTFEYYTKLSHFSVGADVDVFYAVAFDLGVNGTGYMKYTF